MDEYQIECAIQRKTDVLDAAYMAGLMSYEEYRAAQREIATWAERTFLWEEAAERARRRLG